MNENCYCGSDRSYDDCCQKIHNNPKTAESAEQLMRARYSAFALHLVGFIYETFHPTTRRFQKKTEIEQWSKENKWIGLEIIKSTENTVEFKAFFINPNAQTEYHHEKSRFQKIQKTWYYLDGKLLT